MSIPDSLQAQLPQVFLQVMAKHGVVLVKNALGRVGTLSMLPNGQVTHFGLSVQWIRPQERAAFWAMAGLRGAPGRVTGDEVLFFQELMRALYGLGVQRAVWNEDTKVMLVPDSSRPQGMRLRFSDLNCVARGEEPQGLHL